MNSRSEEEIFAEVILRKSPEDRLAYLDLACGGDTDLRRGIERLLQASERAGEFMERSPGTSARLDLDSALSTPGRAPNAPGIGAEAPGTRLGRYRLIEQLGEGGYGTVYLAEQEEPVRRQVALKIIKLGMDTRSVIARFEAERQALALMDHPNIAKVLDAGATDTGRPFFVMEFVRGLSIVHFCDEQRLTVTRRIQLFIQVCQAIQHAHQKGIIHRDIKPSNILVTLGDGQPIPKVIDFGIAKAVEGRLADRTLVTVAEQFIGTPAYMSPEQADREHLDVDTRSDIYSLGVVLYELLTGFTPFESKGLLSGGLEQARRTILEVEPPTPSTRLGTLKPEVLANTARQHGTEGTRLPGLIRGDLDWIVVKCLEKDRTRRYETANGLAADLRRHLRHEPVVAGPPGWGYRLGKGIQRHRVAVTMAGVIALILVGGLGLSLGQAVRATRAEREQKHQATLADTARQRAERGEAASRDLLYFATMNRVRHAWEEENMVSVGQLLKDVAGYDQRGFEWYFWHGQLRRDVRTFRGHSAPVTGAEFLPDGRRVVSSSLDGAAKVWDAGDGAILRTLVEPSGAITAQTVASDGRRVITGSRTGMVAVWDPETGTSTLRFQAASTEIDGLALSPDSRFLLTTSLGQPIGLWDIDSGRNLGQFGEHLRRGKSIAFLPDSQQILSADLVAVCFWELPTLKKRFRFQIAGMGDTFATAPNGRSILLAESGPQASLWNMIQYQPLVTFTGHSSAITAVAFSPDGRAVLTGDLKGTTRSWTLTGDPLLTFKGHQGRITSAAFSPNVQWIVTGSADGTAKIWSAALPRVLELQTAAPGYTREIRCMALMPDERRLVTGDANGAVRIWEFASGREIRSLAGHDDEIGSLALSQDGRQIATGSWDHTARLWDADTGSERRVLRGHQGRITGVAWSPDGEWVVTADDVGEARIWETATGIERFRFHHGPGFSTVACSPDGRWIAAGGVDGVVTLWESASGRWVRTVGAGDTIRVLMFSPDSQRVIAGLHDGRGLGWESATGDLQLLMAGHSSELRSVAFSPDGSRILTAGGDGTLRLWDSGAGRELLILQNASSSGELACFSNEGRRIVANRGVEIHVWDAASESEVTEWERSASAHGGNPAPSGGVGSGSNPSAPGETIAGSIEFRADLAARLREWNSADGMLHAAIGHNPDQVSAWIRRSPLLLHLNNPDAYRLHRSRMLARFGNTTNPVVAEQVARNSLLLPVSSADEMVILDRLGEQVAKEDAEGTTGRYRELAKGLIGYRKGDFSEAERWLRKAQEGVDLEAEDENILFLTAQANLIMAMTQYRLDQVEEAKSTLTQAESLPVAKPEYDYGERWHERLIVQILIREARELIGSIQSPPPPTDVRP